MIGYSGRGSSSVVVGGLVAAILLNVFSLPHAGLDVVRTVVGFLLVTILPGYVLLSLFEVPRLSVARRLFYAVGLSLIYTLAIVLVVNFTLPAAGIVTPLTSEVLSIALAVPLLLIWLNLGPRDSKPPVRSKDLSPGSVPVVLLSTLLPIYAAVGTHIVNITGQILLIVPLLLVIAIVPLLCIRWELPSWARVYVVWTVALTVLLHMTLISWHIWGWDIHYQYHVAEIINNAQYWDPYLPMGSNSLISITLLASVYSILTGLEIVWVYKIFYAVLASLVPVGAYFVFDRIFSNRDVVVLAPFVLIFYYGFFKDMPDKQLIALLFFVMVLAALLDSHLSNRLSITLGSLFGIGVVVSHYGVSLLLIGFLVFTSITMVGARQYTSLEPGKSALARPHFALFLGGFWLFWFGLSAAGVNLESIIQVGYTSILEVVSGSTERSGADYATRESQSLAWLIYQGLYMGLVGLLGVGILASVGSIYYEHRPEVAPAFLAFSVAVFAFLCGSVLVTFGMGFDRTLQIALVVLAPYAILGLQSVVSLLSRGISVNITDRFGSTGQLFAVFLVILFIFSSGVGFAIIDGEQPSYNIALDRDAGWPVYDQNEVDASRWVDSHHGDEPVAIFNRWEATKSRDGLLLSEVLFDDDIDGAWEERETIDDSSYIYLSEKPMTEPESDTEYIDPQETAFYEHNVVGADRIYHSGGAEVYYVR